MPDGPGESLAAELVRKFAERKLTLATAESCTGGLVAAALTNVPGSSDMFYGGYVTYANSAKSRMIGVEARMIRDHGAVSAQVARAMANGARNTARTDYAIAVTGIAGPSGGSERKPVGLVYFACATSDDTLVTEKRFGDVGRDSIRKLSVEAALQLLLSMLDGPQGKPEPG